MIKFTKNLLLNPAEIRISNINCSFNNIVKIASLFDFKWIIVTIDSVTEDSLLLTLVKNQGLKFFVKPRSPGLVEISTVAPYTLFSTFLDGAIKENPENIFVYNLLNPSNIVMCLQRPFEELVIAGIADVFISISFDENALLICANKTLISAQELFKKLRALCFE